MCDYCESYRCPPSCPSYEGDWEGSGVAVGRCALCEGVLHAGERALMRGRDAICLGCAEAGDLDTLLFLEGAECFSELLCERLGWESRYM